MKFYEYVTDPDRFGSFEFQEAYTSEGFEVSGKFNEGQRLTKIWKPHAVKLHKSKHGFPDFSKLAGTNIPAFSERAWVVLSPLLGDSIEALPLVTPLESFVALNMIEVLDCLDHSRSEFKGRANNPIVTKYSFKPGCVVDHHLFHIPEMIYLSTIISEGFKDIVIRESLSGLNFDKIIYEES